jgi:integrase
MPKVAKELPPITIARKYEAGVAGEFAVGGVPGLEFHVKGERSANWILRIRVNGKRTKIGVGSFPSVKLAEAREAARKLRAKAAENIDPVQAREAERRANEAKATGRQLFWKIAGVVNENEIKGFTNGKHIQQWLREIQNVIGDRWDGLYVDEINHKMVAEVLAPGWMVTSETHRRVQKRLVLIFQHAIFFGWYEGINPAVFVGNLDQILKKRKDQKPVVHHLAEPWEDCPMLMDRLRSITSAKSRTTARALEFLILSAVRSNVVRSAEWSEFDFVKKLWHIPKEKMKGKKDRKRPHTVPLTPRMLEILGEMDRTTELVFPPRPIKKPKKVLSPGQKRTMSDATMSGMCKDLEIVGVPHGFRSSFADWSLEHGYSRELSERALAHAEKDKVRAAYVRTKLLNQRIAMMNHWDAFLTGRLSSENGDPISSASAIPAFQITRAA